MWGGLCQVKHSLVARYKKKYIKTVSFYEISPPPRQDIYLFLFGLKFHFVFILALTKKQPPPLRISHDLPFGEGELGGGGLGQPPNDLPCGEAGNTV